MEPVHALSSHYVHLETVEMLVCEEDIRKARRVPGNLMLICVKATIRVFPKPWLRFSPLETQLQFPEKPKWGSILGVISAETVHRVLMRNYLSDRQHLKFSAMLLVCAFVCGRT